MWVFALFSNEINENYYLNTVNGLETLQHRGQESAGIVYIENNNFVIDKIGLVRDTFAIEKQVKTNMFRSLGIQHLEQKQTH